MFVTPRARRRRCKTRLRCVVTSSTAAQVATTLDCGSHAVDVLAVVERLGVALGARCCALHVLYAQGTRLRVRPRSRLAFALSRDQRLQIGAPDGAAPTDKRTGYGGEPRGARTWRAA
jgi:hypothetical protein